jgi:hypothetical protein
VIAFFDWFREHVGKDVRSAAAEATENVNGEAAESMRWTGRDMGKVPRTKPQQRAGHRNRWTATVSYGNV